MWLRQLPQAKAGPCDPNLIGDQLAWQFLIYFSQVSMMTAHKCSILLSSSFFGFITLLAKHGPDFHTATLCSLCNLHLGKHASCPYSMYPSVLDVCYYSTTVHWYVLSFLHPYTLAFRISPLKFLNSSDAKCYCNSSDFQSSAAQCIQGSCTPAEKQQSLDLLKALCDGSM